MKLKKLISLALAGVMCLSLAACGTSNSSTEPAALSDSTETNVVLCESWDFSSGLYPLLIPSTASNYGFAFWAQNCYDTLVTYDENGEIVGALAETWEVSDDGLTYTFHLREGVKFSDGTDLTADAVKQSYDSAPILLDAYNGSYGKLTTIMASTEAVDENTFVLTLSQPYYAALNDMTYSNPLAIVNPKAFENGVENATASCASATMGTGAYMFDSVDGDTYTFVKNPCYWGKEPEVDSFQVKVIADNDAKALALRNGEIDMINGIDKMSYDAFTELSAEDYGNAQADQAYKTYYLGMNLAKAPFDDLSVRQAAAYAIDQQSIETSVFNGMETAAEIFFSTELANCDVEQTIYNTDTKKANELLEAVGWLDSDGDGVREKDGQPLTVSIIYTNALASIDNAMLTVESQLEAVGFDVTLTGADIMTLYTTVGSGKYDMAYWYTNGGAFDPSSVVTNMNSASSADPIAYQFSAFFDGGNSLLNELDSTSNEARVQEIYNIVLGTISEQCLAVPVSNSHEAALWDSELISGYDFPYDSKYVSIANIHLK
jgi:nickel transport system substrate-binding protein